MNENKTKINLKSVLNILGTILNVILALIVLLNAYTIVARAITKKSSVTVLGVSWAVVLTDSMNGDEPDSFAANSLIFTVKAKEYEVGDIITFESPLGTVTHRIVGMDEEGFITQGDANNAPDTERVKQGMIVGKVFLSIPGIGTAIRSLSTPLGSMILILVCFALIGAPIIFKRQPDEAESAHTDENGTQSASVPPEHQATVNEKNDAEAADLTSDNGNADTENLPTKDEICENDGKDTSAEV